MVPLKTPSHPHRHQLPQLPIAHLRLPKVTRTQTALPKTERTTHHHTFLLMTLHYMTAHPILRPLSTLHIPIRPHPLHTHRHNLRIPILLILLAVTQWRHPFWKPLLHKLPKFTQARTLHTGVLNQILRTQPVTLGNNGLAPWQEILRLKIATVPTH
jgi:hypothetical protein